MARLMPEQNRTWFKASLTQLAKGLFTDSFYPSKSDTVFFTQVDVTPISKKVIVATKLVEANIRILTLELANKCLVRGEPASISEMETLNTLTRKLRI